MKPLENMFCQGLHLSDFRIDPIFIVYWMGKSRPLINEFCIRFYTSQQVNQSNDSVILDVDVNQRHVLIAEILSFL